MSVVFWKELADHFSSRRFMILLALIVLIGLWATYASGQAIRQDTENAPTQYVFLFLLTSGTGTVFSLATFLGFFGPLVGITLGFDSISGEYARRNFESRAFATHLSRQPDQWKIFCRLGNRSHPLGLDSLAGDRLGDHIAWISSQR